MGGLWFGWSWGHVSSPFLLLLSVLCFLNLSDNRLPQLFPQIGKHYLPTNTLLFFFLQYPYQWKWALRCDRGTLVRKMNLDKSRSLYLVLRSWADIKGTAQFSEWELGQYWVKQCLIHWNAWAYLFKMHFNTLEGSPIPINCHWFCGTQGKLLAPSQRNHSCSSPTTKTVPCNPIHHRISNMCHH